jgi:hypothetical protein
MTSLNSSDIQFERWEAAAILTRSKKKAGCLVGEKDSPKLIDVNPPKNNFVQTLKARPYCCSRCSVVISTLLPSSEGSIIKEHLFISKITLPFSLPPNSTATTCHFSSLPNFSVTSSSSDDNNNDHKNIFFSIVIGDSDISGTIYDVKGWKL